MPTDPEHHWIGQWLSAEADGHELDLDALLGRIMPEVRASLEGRPTPPPGLRLPAHPRPLPPDQAGPADPPRVVDHGTADHGTAVLGRAVHGRTVHGRTVHGRVGPGGRSLAPHRPLLLPALLTAAAVGAVSLTGALLPGRGQQHRPGTVRVEGNQPHPGPVARTDGPGSGTAPSGTAPPGTAPSGTAPATRAGAGGAGGSRSLPRSFRWRSTGPLVSVRPDASHAPIGIKDPSVVYYRGSWHVFATAALSSTSYALEYLSFRDWSQAGTAPQHYLDASPIGAGYRAAPQVFWFAPQKLWYLVYQTGNASYSTNPDLTDPAGWSAPKNFFPAVPDVVQQHLAGGYWTDMWVICDAATCYLFSTDVNGHLYRSQTRAADFPRGMSPPTIVLQEQDRLRLLTGSSVYRVDGTDSYLLLVGAVDPQGRGYYRSWTSTSPAGTWTPLADTPDAPFAGAADVTFGATAWTRDIGQGELVRSGFDQTMTIDPCRLQYLYQGTPWQLGLLTQTSSTCS